MSNSGVLPTNFFGLFLRADKIADLKSSSPTGAIQFTVIGNLYAHSAKARAPKADNFRTAGPPSPNIVKSIAPRAENSPEGVCALISASATDAPDISRHLASDARSVFKAKRDGTGGENSPPSFSMLSLSFLLQVPPIANKTKSAATILRAPSPDCLCSPSLGCSPRALFGFAQTASIGAVSHPQPEKSAMSAPRLGTFPSEPLPNSSIYVIFHRPSGVFSTDSTRALQISRAFPAARSSAPAIVRESSDMGNTLPQSSTLDSTPSVLKNSRVFAQPYPISGFLKNPAPRG